MPDPPRQFVYFNCDGGLNLESSPFELNENEMQKAKNGLITRKGYEKRKGYAEYITDPITDALATATGIDNIYRFYSAYGTFTIAVGICPTDYKLCYHDGTSWTALVEDAGATLTHSSHVRFEVYRKRLFIYNGSEFWYWDGTGNAYACEFYGATDPINYLTTIIPKAMAIADDRIMVVPADDDEVVWYTDANGWDSVATTELKFGVDSDLPLPERTNNLNGIINLVNYGLNDDLLAKRENDIWILAGVGPTDYQWIKLDEGGGNVAAEGVVAVQEVARPNEPTRESYLLSVGNGKIFMVQGGACDSVSAPVRKRLRNKGLSGAVAVYDGDNEIVLISVNNTTLVWDCSKLVWASEWDINFDCAFRCTAHSDYNAVLFGWKTSVYVWQLNSGTDDNGDNILFWFQSKAFTFLESAETKEVRHFQVLCDTKEDTPCSMTIYVDETTVSSAVDIDVKRKTGGNTKWGVKKWGTFKWGGRKKRMATVSLSDGLKGNSFSYKISSNDTNDLTIYQVGVEVGLESLRRKYN